jgi:hypothetical protein
MRQTTSAWQKLRQYSQRGQPDVAQRAEQHDHAFQAHADASVRWRAIPSHQTSLTCFNSCKLEILIRTDGDQTAENEQHLELCKKNIWNRH